MAKSEELDKLYHFIMLYFIEHGRGPHYTEIADAFSLAPEEGRRFLHDLMALALPNWLYPQTDLIASFAPFHNLPTQYKITVQGRQKWFAQ